jgi:ribose-phosphate pyrophosphokinase
MERFLDGELSVRVEDPVEGVRVFIVQPTCPPVNENLMESLP